MRDAFRRDKLVIRMVADLKELLNADDIIPEADTLNLWDDKEGLVKFGIQYKDDSESDGYKE